MSANDIQVGASHYKDKAVQPWDYIASNNLGYFEGNVVKYVTRWKDKGGVEDLRKARHYIDKLIELETQLKPEYKGDHLILPKDNGSLWIKHDGVGRPIFVCGQKVQVKHRNGNEQTIDAEAPASVWDHIGLHNDIIAYRVIE